MANILIGLHRIVEKWARFFAFPCCPIQLPWFKFRNNNSPVLQLRRLVFIYKWRDGRKITLFILAFLWPIKAALLACANVIKFGAPVEKEYGTSKWKQLGQMLSLANFYNISPNAYYVYRFFEISNIRKAQHYLHNSDLVLLSELNKNLDTSLIDDKARFFRQCIQYDLPTPSVAALFYDDGKEERIDCQPHSLPPCDLFLKFTNSSLGKGAERWAYEEDHAKVWRRGLLRLDNIQMAQYCRQKAVKNKRPLMVQRRLVNDAELAPFSLGALCTFRVVTYLTPDTRAALLVAGLKMPVGEVDVDNLEAGGIAAGIDLEHGVLGPACGKKFGARLIQCHPDTQAQITGHKLNCWKKIAELSIKAHERFREPLSIGWDVAMTTQGPVLIEGNTIFGLELSQILLGKPLGETILPSLYLKASQRQGQVH